MDGKLKHNTSNILRADAWRMLLHCLPLVVALQATAQTTRFACNNLQRLAATLQEEHGMDGSRPHKERLGQNIVVLTQDSLGQIDHIGFHIFPDYIVSENPSPVYQFVERYLLELYLYPELPTPEQRLKEDKVILRFPGHEGEPLRQAIANHLPRFDSQTSLIVLTDNNRYSVSIYEAGKPLLSIRFPIRYELLWGMNKKEAEANFYPTLMFYRSPKPSSAVPLPQTELSRLVSAGADSCFVLPGEFYQIESVNNDLFYRLQPDGRYFPLIDNRWPEASIRNLFLLPDLAPKITASVTQRLYSRRTQTFDIPLHSLLSFCLSTGCQPYVGIETADANYVTGTVVLLNPAFGYCHQLYFRAPTGILSSPSQHKLELELYAYVPTHNIKNLFYEHKK